MFIGVDLPGGTEFMRQVRVALGDPSRLSGPELERRRALVEEMVYRQVASGNVPDFMRPQNFTSIRLERTINGEKVVATIRVCPDYLAVGSNDDYVLVPIDPRTAQRIADRVGLALPTQMVVDIIEDEAKRTGGYLPFHAAPEIAGNVTNPRTKKPVVDGEGGKKWNYQTYGFYEGSWMVSAEFTAEQNRLIQQSIARAGNPVYIRSGHKKDVIYDNLAFQAKDPRVIIYHPGIQGLSNIHEITYHDYSHGIRYLDMNVELTITGKDGRTRRETKTVAEILRDPNLCKLLAPAPIDISRMYRSPELSGVPARAPSTPPERKRQVVR